ncbi:MAG: aminopeptidase [Clostridiales bacterium]
MEKITKGIEEALFYCLGLQKHENLLLVTDEIKAHLCDLFFEVARDHGINVAVLKMTGLEMSGTEPGSFFGSALRAADAAVLLTQHSLSHTRAREKASKRGTRIASLPGFTRQMLAGPMMVDYEKMGKLTEKLSGFLDSAQTAYLLGESGTELTMSLDERAGFADLGIYREKGDCGNLPAGEAYIAPQEGTANGIIVLDGSITEIGKISEPVTLKVEHGIVTTIKGGAEAKALEKVLYKAGKGAGNIAELGLGTNEGAVLMGDTLNDEKVVGTAHIALGDNLNYGGRVDSNCHLDCVLKNATLYLDDILIIDQGKIVV